MQVLGSLQIQTSDDIFGLEFQTINLDHYITHNLPFSKINEGFQLLQEAKCLRAVLYTDKL
jgi:Zn-dependent alcohol dehydrogenase